MGPRCPRLPMLLGTDEMLMPLVRFLTNPASTAAAACSLSEVFWGNVTAEENCPLSPRRAAQALVCVHDCDVGVLDKGDEGGEQPEHAQCWVFDNKKARRCEERF